MTETTRSNRAKLYRYFRWAVLVLVLAYLAQFLWASSHKGQSKMGAAFETIAYEAFRKQYDGLPEMRVVGGNSNPNTPVGCPSWNFERTWGKCVIVALNVRDYLPEHQSIVEREVMKLAEQLRKPCTLLPTLGIPNEHELAHDLECSGDRRLFKLEIKVNSVTVISDRGPASKPHRWQVTNHKHLNSFHYKGEL